MPGMDEVFAPLPPEGREGQGDTGGQQQRAGAADPGGQQQVPQGAQQQPQGSDGGQGGDGGGLPGDQGAAGAQPQGQQGAAPPAAGTESRTVPLEALEAERRTRQDWKGKAERAETEAQMLRQRLARYEQQQQPPGQPGGQQQQPQQQPDPVVQAVQRVENVALNVSERAARTFHGTETVDKAWARVQQEFAQNPALYQQIIGSPDPWDQVVQQGKRLLAMDEIGTDPAAYRKKLEEQIRAEMAAAGPAAAASPAPQLPESLAGARSAGARGTTWTGPTPMENLFNN